MNIPIIYEDDWLVVVDKPAGLLTIPTPKNERRTLTSILNGDLKEKNVSYRLHPCHRLDRGTSGLIIYAKGKAMQQRMMELFKQKRVKKNYIAFVHGRLAKNKQDIAIPVEGHSALTKYKVILQKKDFAVVEAKPLTGRRNQIRIHFKAIGNPIVGETKFIFRRDYALRAKRLCLHARDLEFVHPVLKRNINIASELPDDLKEFLSSHDG